MRDLSMHVLDIVQNSLAAGSTEVEIRIHEHLPEDLLVMVVKDNGRGIPKGMLPRVTDPFITSRQTREVGLGLSLLKEAAERCAGGLEVYSEEGRGTTVVASFRHDHFDRAPLGDMGETLGVLIAANPDLDFLYEHRVDDRTYLLDTRQMRQILGSVGLEDPTVLDFVRRDIEMGLKKIGAASFPKILEVLK